MKLYKLAGRMVEKGVSQVRLAEFLGYDFSTINRKINGDRKFDVEDAIRICDLLCIPYEEIPLYFTQRGNKNDNNI